MGNYICPQCGATAGGPGRCGQHPIGERPKLKFVDGACYQPPEPRGYPWPEAARAYDDALVADKLRAWQQQLEAS